MKSILNHQIFVFLLLFAFSVCVKAQADEESRSRNQPVKPFRVIGNIYYVGASDITSFLITTPKGHILIDQGFAETAPQIIENIKKLGFKLEDVKILLNTQAHNDHAGGLAELKKVTNAKLFASEADALLIANGGKGDFAFGDRLTYLPVTTDHILRDKEEIKFGGVTLKTYLTPGHTKGSTTWTMKVKENGKTYNVVFLSSTTAPGYKLLNNSLYPNIVADYEYTFRVLKSLPCDVFLASHGVFFSLLDKIKQLEAGAKTNPFIDPKSYRDFIENTEQDLKQKLEKERKEAASTEKKLQL